MSTETLNPDEFDIISFIEGSNYPEIEQIVYTDGKAALALRAEFEKSEDEQDAATIARHRQAIEQSALTFTLRGLAPKVIEIMTRQMEINSKDISEEERLARLMKSTDSLVAGTIVKVTTANGKVDTRAWDADRAASLRGVLVAPEYEKLMEAVNTVNFDARLFESEVDAGFPRRRSE